MTHPSDHYPVPVTVETGEDIGGIKIITGTTIQVRCGCRHDLGYDYGHETEDEQ